LRIGISARFLLAFTILLAVMAAMGGFAVVKIGEVNALTAELRDRWLPASQELGDVHASSRNIASGRATISRPRRPRRRPATPS
jgi:hypothetical protein